MKLPKLETKKFSGRIEEWQEFWDSFESAIHTNTKLSSVDKFSYLRGLLMGGARTSIAGLALTSANYEAATEILKRRFGKKTAIERTHINDLLKAGPVQNDKNTSGLRKLYDTVEVHHRGLQALGVNANTYEGIVVPSILSKLPETVRLQITRGKNYEQWTMEEMLQELLCELELREEHCMKKTERQDIGTCRGGPATVSALLTRTLNDFCAYCKGKHAHEECMNVKSVDERRNLLRNYGRCFICAKKGHIARECKCEIVCKCCNKPGHHISICYKGHNAYQAPYQVNRANNSHRDVSQNACQVSASHASPALHVGLVGRVALQTAQAIISGNKGSRVRVSFDAGSHKSFITTRAVQSAGLRAERREWIEINTFGQLGKDSGLSGVYEFQVFPLQGGDGIKIEAYEVPNITQIRNEHIEVKKSEYPHLQGLWFSDVSRDSEILEVDLLIGADYLWSFQEGRAIRGEPNDPVAIETRLGWVLKTCKSM